MADNNDILEDTKAWTRFICGDGEGDICVYRRCPECGRYLKKGDLYTNKMGDVKPEKWICKKHGEVEPFYLRD